MTEKRLKRDNFNIHLINNKNCHTIDIRIYFTENVTKEKISYHNMLIDVMCSSTKKYDTKRKLLNACGDLYSTCPYAACVRYGRLLCTKFILVSTTSRYLNNENILNNIELLSEIILNPLVEQEKFVTKYFDTIKKNLIIEGNTIYEEPRLYANIKVLESMISGDNQEFKLNNYPNPDIVKDITRDSLYQCYLEMLNNSKIDIFIAGNLVNEKAIINKINECFVFKNRRKNILLDAKINHPLTKVILKKEREIKAFKQSKLSVGFKVYNVSSFENKYVLSVFNYLLGSSGDALLLRHVRKDQSLAYYIDSYFNKLDNILIVNCGINKNNYDRVIDTINNTIMMIREGKFTKKDLQMCQEEYLVSLDSFLESNNGLIEYYYGKEVFNSDSLEERVKIIKSITKEDVMSFASKVQMENIFFLEGSYDDV